MTLGADKTMEYLHSFSCPSNQDVESFLHSRAIRFEKVDATRTYLVLDMTGMILAYFSLTFKELPIHDFILSKSKIKKLDGISNRATSLKVYLIGQIAKNFSLQGNPIKLKDILIPIEVIIEKAQYLIGGRTIILECKNENKIVKLYQSHGFKIIPHKREGEKNTLITMILNN
ncbi:MULTISPECIES: acetyltransferase [unclassified Xenorhabdus]|uniref:acetyltransferase n=1 Tax=Xenorhabdus TaxID=626 RepID=UPI000C064446|nr:acetyltransferase [Xenorhabdus sp. KJ12.1]PHM68231.1 acetyltransferase [Xenorhabdus sp. KJ12.1]